MADVTPLLRLEPLVHSDLKSAANGDVAQPLKLVEDRVYGLGEGAECLGRNPGVATCGKSIHCHPPFNPTAHEQRKWSSTAATCEEHI